MSDNKKVLKGLNFPGLEGTYYVPEAVAYEEENGYIDVQSVVSDTVEIENLDTTLTRAGFAADAKAVGEALQPYIIPIYIEGGEYPNYQYSLMPDFVFNWNEIIDAYASNKQLIIKLYNKQYQYTYEDFHVIHFNDPISDEFLLFQKVYGTLVEQFELYLDGSIYMYRIQCATDDSVDQLQEQIGITSNYSILHGTMYNLASSGQGSYVIANYNGVFRSTNGRDWAWLPGQDSAENSMKYIIYSHGIYAAISNTKGYVFFSFDDGKTFVRYDGLKGHYLSSIAGDSNHNFAILDQDTSSIYLLNNVHLTDEGALELSLEYDEALPENTLCGLEKLVYGNNDTLYAVRGDSIYFVENGAWNSGVQASYGTCTDAIAYGDYIVIASPTGIAWFNTKTSYYKNDRFEYANHTNVGDVYLAANEEANCLYILNNHELITYTQLTVSDDKMSYSPTIRPNRTNHKNNDNFHGFAIASNGDIIALKHYRYGADGNSYIAYYWTSLDDLADFTIRQNAKYHASTDNTNKLVRASIEAAPNYTYGTEDLEPGVTALETGTLYFVYE